MIKKPLKILILVSSIMTFVGSIFTPFYITYIQSLNQSFLFAGSSLALFSIVTGIFVFIFGKVGSHYANKKNLISLGYITRGLAFIVVAVSLSSAELIRGLIMLAIGTAISLPAFDALYTKHIHTTDSSVQWAGLQSVSYIIAGIAAYVGTVLIQHFGFREIFMSLGVLALLVGIYVYFNKDLMKIEEVSI